MERLYFDASEVPALTFSLHSLSWFFRVMLLEAGLICSQRFLPFLHTKEHINLTGSTDISLQHLDFAELHQLPCQIVLPHRKPGQQEWGSKQMTAHCWKYGLQPLSPDGWLGWGDRRKIYKCRGKATFSHWMLKCCKSGEFLTDCSATRQVLAEFYEENLQLIIPNLITIFC